MNFILLIKSGHSSSAALSAYHFAHAALKKQHQIQQVFFYQDGVYLANNLSASAQDDVDIYMLWASLAQKHQIPLLVCSAAAAKRGVISTEDMAYHNKTSSNVDTPFMTTGLSQLISAIALADRVISFGA